MSYQQVADDINRAKSAMQTAGVGKGSVVAIIANNRREWVVAAYASLALGASGSKLIRTRSSTHWTLLEDKTACSL
jgi:long-subunit acyl-CoA synthetase (AMP-forming)